MANHWLWKRHSYHVNRFEDLQKSFKRTEQGMVAQAFLKHNEIEFLESSWYLLSCLSMTIFQVTFYILWFYRHVSCELALISERLEHEGLDQKYPARCLWHGTNWFAGWRRKSISNKDLIQTVAWPSWLEEDCNTGSKTITSSELSQRGEAKALVDFMLHDFPKRIESKWQLKQSWFRDCPNAIQRNLVLILSIAVSNDSRGWLAKHTLNQPGTGQWKAFPGVRLMFNSFKIRFHNLHSASKVFSSMRCPR